jgi:hypothetical protein
VLDCAHSLALPARYMGARSPIYQVYTNISYLSVCHHLTLNNPFLGHPPIFASILVELRSSWCSTLWTLSIKLHYPDTCWLFQHLTFVWILIWLGSYLTWIKSSNFLVRLSNSHLIKHPSWNLPSVLLWRIYDLLDGTFKSNCNQFHPLLCRYFQDVCTLTPTYDVSLNPPITLPI